MEKNNKTSDSITGLSFFVSAGKKPSFHAEFIFKTAMLFVLLSGAGPLFSQESAAADGAAGIKILQITDSSAIPPKTAEESKARQSGNTAPVVPGQNLPGRTIPPALNSESKQVNNDQSAPAGQASRNTGLVQPENLIGLDPAGAFAKAGTPEAVYPLRGQSQWQDDVIFYYSSGIYLFFYNNRVWQVRGDYRFSGNILGISPGMAKARTREILGNPYHSDISSDIYLNPAGVTRLDKGYPLRLRIIFDEADSVADIYLYRGDY